MEKELRRREKRFNWGTELNGERRLGSAVDPGKKYVPSRGRASGGRVKEKGAGGTNPGRIGSGGSPPRRTEIAQEKKDKRTKQSRGVRRKGERIFETPVQGFSRGVTSDEETYLKAQGGGKRARKKRRLVFLVTRYLIIREGGHLECAKNSYA